MQFEIAPKSMFASWFSTTPEPAKQPAASGGTIAHIFVDCAKTTDVILTLIETVDAEMRGRGHQSYVSFLTYIVSSGSESINVVDAFRIFEIIGTFTFSHRIEMKKGAQEHESSYALMCELGKCLGHVKPNDVLFIYSPDNLVFSNIVHSGKPTVDIVRIGERVVPVHTFLPPPAYDTLNIATEEEKQDDDKEEQLEEKESNVTIETSS